MTGRYRERGGARADDGMADPTGGPPHGWYYYGPTPPWREDGGRTGGQGGDHGEGPGWSAGRDAHADMMEAVDRLARGDLSAETLGRLLAFNDRDFWKGAVVGSIAVLALTKQPAVKAMVMGLAAQALAAGKARAAASPKDSAATDQDADKDG